jgi:surfactin synthase thioesterase subunit
MKSNWLIRKTGVVRRFRLYCFCYGGGNANRYIPWQAQLNPEIEVCAIQLPGRGARMHEAPYQSMELLVEDIAAVILRDSQLPFAFFGHSLGGLLAFELARYFARNLLTLPRHLFASGCDSPQLRSPPKNMHLLPHDELINKLRDYNGTPPEILEHRELMELILPTIRADFALAEEYQYRPGLQLNVPITVMVGKQDPEVLPKYVDGWAKETTRTCDVRWFDGDHFFIVPQEQAVLECISAVINEIRETSQTSQLLDYHDL